MKRRVYILFLAAALCQFAVFARPNDQLSFSVSTVPQYNEFTFTLQNDLFLVNFPEFRAGLTFDAGWGLQYNTSYGSKQLIYGYAIALGFKNQTRIMDNWYLDVDIKENIVYPLFPVILWNQISVGTTYYFNRHLFLRETIDFYFFSSELRIGGNATCGIKF